ncbi:MAG: hypothetical protein LBE14_08000 [Treponema sp.]|jgi:hypothetical protein|nr:hypothetical protein [Treponema sp.]
MEIVKKLPPRYAFRRRQGTGLVCFLLLVPLFFSACNQDPIFYTIAQEVKLLEPRIKGTPTNIVFFAGKIYVANRSSLYRYGRPAADQNPVWDKPSQPGGEIRGLAATTGYLYALTGNGLKRLSAANAANGGDWESVGIDDTGTTVLSYPSLQTIYADSQMLFAGSGNGAPNSASSNYAILYADESENKLKGLIDGVHLLTGAALSGTNHFLSTAGSGIYVFNGAGTPLPIPNTEDSHITGIIAMADDTVAAADRSGNILKVTASGSVEVADINYRTTGALALWRSPPVSPDTSFKDDDQNHPDKAAPNLLLAGIQGSTSSTSQTYTNGYRELVLNSTGSLPDSSVTISTPGDGTPTTVSNNATYTSSLGELPINYIFQVPYTVDPAMPLFASTHGEDGLWSYRQRSEGPQWNAEE